MAFRVFCQNIAPTIQGRIFESRHTLQNTPALQVNQMPVFTFRADLASHQANHGHGMMALFDKSNNLVKKITGTMARDSLSVQLTPALLSGDNGSVLGREDDDFEDEGTTARVKSIKWNVATADFATGRVDLVLAGMLLNFLYTADNTLTGSSPSTISFGALPASRFTGMADIAVIGPNNTYSALVVTPYGNANISGKVVNGIFPVGATIPIQGGYLTFTPGSTGGGDNFAVTDGAIHFAGGVGDLPNRFASVTAGVLTIRLTPITSGTAILSYAGLVPVMTATGVVTPVGVVNLTGTLFGNVTGGTITTSGGTLNLVGGSATGVATSALVDTTGISGPGVLAVTGGTLNVTGGGTVTVAVGRTLTAVTGTGGLVVSGSLLDTNGKAINVSTRPSPGSYTIKAPNSRIETIGTRVTGGSFSATPVGGGPGALFGITGGTFTGGASATPNTVYLLDHVVGYGRIKLSIPFVMD